MRRLLLIAACAALLAAGSPPGTPAAEEAATTGSAAVGAPARAPVRDQNCLSAADMREVVAERQVVEPVAAIRAARQALPKAEIVRANLCRHAEGGAETLVYLITALHRDGHFVHVTVDARSGNVADLW